MVKTSIIAMIVVFTGAFAATCSAFAGHNNRYGDTDSEESGGQGTNTRHEIVHTCVMISAKGLVVNRSRYGGGHVVDKDDESFEDVRDACRQYILTSYELDCLRGKRALETSGSKETGSKKYLFVVDRPPLTSEQIRSCSNSQPR
jgi:hypothetical protein